MNKLILLGLFSFAAVSFAQPKPNLTGTWKLNVAKSDFGVMPPPESQTDVIEHNDPALKISVNSLGSQGNMSFVIATTTDGKETTLKIGPQDAKLIAAWDGTALMLNAKLSVNEQEIALKMALTLSDDGQTLTQKVHMVSAMGEMDQKMLFEKQPSDTIAKVEIPAKVPSGPRPNFTGVWKLNAAKSDFGVMPPPDSRVDTINHTDPNLTLAREESGPQGSRKYTLKTVTDGTEVDNDTGGPDVKIAAAWDGPALVSTIKIKLQDQDITIKQVSTLSPDGKVLTNKNHLVSAMGEMDMTEVYEKQP